MYKFEIHCHTIASDGQLQPREVAKILAEKGFDGFAITDHDTIAGMKEAEKAAKEYGLIFVPGVEITTEICDIIALGVKENIEGSPVEIIKKIHNKGGIAILPHPTVDDYSEAYKKRLKIIKLFDAIEVVNSHVSAEKNIAALNLAERYKMPKTAGSDAHFNDDVGSVYTISGHKDIIKAIKENKIGIGWI